MEIGPNDLPLIQADRDAFVRFFEGFTDEVFWGARLMARLSKPRLLEAHRSWVDDLVRVQAREPELGDGLDHFKRSGHLAFWLRRMGPIVEALDVMGMVSEPERDPLTSDQLAFRDLLFGYSNEYTAFDLGLQFCRFYEEDNPRSLMTIDQNYFRMICHFLKFKNVSPHALTLIYKSLFLREE